MSDRDPRRDPIPGDSVQHCVTGVRRSVTSLHGFHQINVSSVGYLPSGRGGIVIERFCNIATWRQWAKGAKVLKRGDE